jgi:hypothetical protein
LKLKVLKLFVALLLCLSIGLPFSACATAANPSDNWIHAYVGTNKDRVESLIQASDGGYVIAGATNVTDSGRLEAWLLKTDARGNQEWNRTYGTSGSAWARCVIQTDDGGYAIAGMANYVADLIKINGYGNMVWNRSYSQMTRADAIIQTTDGGYALAGSSGGLGGSDTFCMVKVDASGNIVWSNSYSQAGNGGASALIQTSDGGYALAGTTENMDFLLVKVDEKGKFDWSKTYGSQDKNAGYSVLQDPDGSIVMAGLMWNRSTYWRAGLVKVDSAGNQLWMKNFPSDGASSRMVRANDGSYVLCGGFLDKISGDGNLVWSKNVTYDDIIEDKYAVSTSLVTPTSDGGFAVASTIQSRPKNPQDMTSYVWIGKLDSQGNQITFVPEFPLIAIPVLAFVISFFAVFSRKCWRLQHALS